MGIQLDNLRVASPCKERWDDMVGDARVRDCARCDKPVFNLSEMTRAEAEALLSTRGLTPCVRFYRRGDGTMVTADCPTSARPNARRLAVVASSFATIAASSTAMADPEEPPPPPAEDAPKPEVIHIDPDITMGLPVIPTTRTFEEVMGGIVMEEVTRPAIEWSVWGRVGAGIASQEPEARHMVIRPERGSTSTWEEALAVDLTFRSGRHSDLRLGVFGEIRTSSDPVAGGELVLDGLRPRPWDSRIGGTGSLVLRAGGGAHVVTGELGFGYIGSFPQHHPWIRQVRHAIGARVVVSMTRSTDAAHDWSATVGLEVDPIGAVHALVNAVRR